VSKETCFLVDGEVNGNMVVTMMLCLITKDQKRFIRLQMRFVTLLPMQKKNKKKTVYNCMDQGELIPVDIKTSKQQQKNCEHLTSIFTPYRK